MKKCRYCEMPIVLGRDDKTFCNKKCKAAFHNQLRIPASLSRSDRQIVAALVNRLEAAKV